MKKAWKLVFTLSLAALALGCLVFGLSVLMDANLVRIADVVFSRYDVPAIYATVANTLSRLAAIL